MLYLIGGASRAGKSILTERLRRHHGLPWLSLDTVYTGLFHNVPSLQLGQPSVTATTDSAIAACDRETLWPIFRQMANNQLFDGRPYIFEGTYLRPHDITVLSADYPGLIRAVFLGYPDLQSQAKRNLVFENQNHPNNWLTKMDAGYIDRYIAYSIDHSRNLKAECSAVGVPFVDTGCDFEAALATATAALLGPQVPRQTCKPAGRVPQP